MITLFYAANACSLAAHVLLEEVDMEHSLRELSLAAGDQREPGFLALNPRGHVPVLLADDQVISESLAVLTWIAMQADRPDLLGIGVLERTRVYERLSFFIGSVHVAYAQFRRPSRFSDDTGAHGSIVEGGRRKFSHLLGEVARMVEDRTWFVGDDFTAADLYPFIFHRWARGVGLELDQFDSWNQHAARMAARPSVRRALAAEGLA
jgi:glutathione S-transferase